MDYIKKEYKDNFYKAILSLQTEEECEAFFDDIATIKELHDLASRFEVARLLNEGKVFNEIIKTTGVSSATIGRVNKCLQHGPGGYRTALARIYDEE